jgi:predicted O-methyltransferase YrrM
LTGGSYSIPEVKSLLRVLAAGRRVAETGTSFGDGAAAMAQTARSVVTVECDPERAAAARQKLAPLENVEVREGDWREQLTETFELVFFDAGNLDEEALALLEPGGLLVKDDLTPGRPIAGDPVREFLFRHPQLVATEVNVTSNMAVVIAGRLPTGRRRIDPSARPNAGA